MKGRFVLIVGGACQLPGWQAEALKLLLEDGSTLLAILLLEPGENLLPPLVEESVAEVPRLSVEDSEGLRALLAGREPHFALCTVEWGQLPVLPMEPLWGFWFWQFGAQPPGRLSHIASADLARGARVTEARLLAWQAKKRIAKELYCGRFRLAIHSPAKSRERVTSSCPVWPRVALRRFGAAPVEFASCPRFNWPEAQPGYSSYGFRIRLAVALLRGVVKRSYEELLREEQWNIGVLERPVASVLADADLSGVAWFDELPGEDYLADPLGIPGSNNQVLAEYFDAGAGRGHLVAIDTECPGRLQVLHRSSGHCSYPLSLWSDGQYYCVPEQIDSGQVTLYPLQLDPPALGEGQVLLADVPGADCTPFERDGRWWMLGGDGEDQDTVKLFAWFSDHLEGPWQPHPLNPLKTDATGARCAGPLFRAPGSLVSPSPGLW